MPFSLNVIMDERTLKKPGNPGYFRFDGGADENRTRDLLLAKQALSQLSYSPEKANKIIRDEERKINRFPSRQRYRPSPSEQRKRKEDNFRYNR